MKYTVTPAEKSTVKIEMTFTDEEWNAATERAFRENRHRYFVNGFRKGKAPKALIERYYGAGVFLEPALNILFADNYANVLESEKENYVFVGEPQVSLGENFSVTNVVLVATTAVKPDVTIEKYTGIKIPAFEYTVTDADVDKEIDAVRERFAERYEVTDRPAAATDSVNIDFVGKKDGVEFEGGSAKGFDLVLGSGQFIPGFEDGVAGMSVGETKDINVTFPEDYSSEELKGQPAVFTVTVNKISGKKVPALDEEFVKKLGSDSVEAYREKVRARLEVSAKNRSRNETEDSILAEIVKGASAEIPDAMVEEQEETAMRNLEQNLMYQGVRLDSYLAYLGTTREQYKKQYEESARTAVLKQLVLEKIIELEKIAATEEEIEAKIAEQAASVGKEPEEYKKTMDPRQRLYIESEIKVTKAFDFLKANNEMTVEAKA